MTVPAMLDHLVYSVPDLVAAVDELAARLDVRPVFGGRHDGRGTHNALLALGEQRYLEIIARDPSQADAPTPLPHELDGLTAARLVTWAARADGDHASGDIERRCEAAIAAGVDLGGVRPLSRALPSGSLLEWRLTGRPAAGDGLVPFLIDWGLASHPSGGAPQGCQLEDLRATHPEPDRIAAMLATMGESLAVELGPVALVATIESPNGRVRLT
ncbi:MAG TPA: VOC family protein [Dehalococcoidia bacterium]|nr:VOC family protein [Dehalococcoidia bacterium]